MAQDQPLLIRDGTLSAYKTKRDSGSLAFREIKIEVSYFPNERLVDLSEQPVVYAMPLGAPEQTKKTRDPETPAFEGEYAVQTALQMMVSPTDNDKLDKLMLLLGQLMQICRRSTLVAAPNKFSWQRSEPLKDENELPYQLGQVRDSHTFEAYFNAFYLWVGS